MVQKWSNNDPTMIQKHTEVPQTAAAERGSGGLFKVTRSAFGTATGCDVASVCGKKYSLRNMTDKKVPIVLQNTEQGVVSLISFCFLALQKPMHLRFLSRCRTLKSRHLPHQTVGYHFACRYLGPCWRPRSAGPGGIL